MPLDRQQPDDSKFNPNVRLPFNLRWEDFKMAMQDVYDFLYDVNDFLLNKGLKRLDDTLRQANMSGMLSDMLTASVAKHSRNMVQNRRHNGHPDLIVEGVYPNDSVEAGEEGVEIKATLKRGGAVDTHGGRKQWFCAFVYEVDRLTEPAINRRALRFTQVFINSVGLGDFRRNVRKSGLGTNTSTLHKAGLQKFRQNWLYLLYDADRERLERAQSLSDGTGTAAPSPRRRSGRARG
jgi:hypothetical protein